MSLDLDPLVALVVALALLVIGLAACWGGR